MKKALIAIVVAFIFASCMGPMYVTSVPTYNNTVDSVIAAIGDQGYTLTGKKHDHRNELRHETPAFEGNVNSSSWIPNELLNYDTYSFADGNGNTMSFSVQYKLSHDHTRGVVYYTDVKVSDWSASNRKDYERLCGAQSPIWMLDTIQKDMTVKP